MESKILTQCIIKFAQLVKNITLIALLFLLIYLMLRQTYYIGIYAIYDSKSVHLILEQILNFFLYLSFFSMIVIYLEKRENFSLRYLIYIGITATVRYIIVNRSDAMQNLLLTLVILLLIFGYLLLTPSMNELRSYFKNRRWQRIEQKRTSIQ
ncbi:MULTISPECIES: phosphate-starvation-inducible PsiE family protein [unclassified Bacillus (in: firmicutes)]|uniref:phosphate-starvation-inducible PsiE family protein n=1 Tax=unclassified Bacillus (in: firmicutes) TaxID=185979 RepID=UPI00211AE97A|nr:MULTISPECIES: phosphate-starvation-inducible PsiE family protein [unclassified Bacillus (in: firmicutes)]